MYIIDLVHYIIVFAAPMSMFLCRVPCTSVFCYNMIVQQTVLFIIFYSFLLIFHMCTKKPLNFLNCYKWIFSTYWPVPFHPSWKHVFKNNFI